MPEYALAPKYVKLKTPIINNRYKLPFLRQDALAALREPQAPSTENQLEALPDELLQHIFCFLVEDPKAIAMLAATSRRMMSILMQPVRSKGISYFPLPQVLLEARSLHQLLLLHADEQQSEEQSELSSMEIEQFTLSAVLLPEERHQFLAQTLLKIKQLKIKITNAEYISPKKNNRLFLGLACYWFGITSFLYLAGVCAGKRNEALTLSFFICLSMMFQLINRLSQSQTHLRYDLIIFKHINRSTLDSIKLLGEVLPEIEDITEQEHAYFGAV